MSKVVIIDKEKISKRHSNGGLFQQGIFKIGKNKFKITIKSDSYDFQSNATLKKWTDEEGFSVIKSTTLKDGYGDNPVYTTPENAKKFFDEVWNDMVSLAKEFV